MTCEPRRRIRSAVAAIALTSAVLGACGNDTPTEATFCAAVEDLRAHNPFAVREVSTPEQMQGSFASLRAAAVTIVDDAPAEVRPQAGRYLDAVDALIEVLSSAGYRPVDVDRLAYDQATSTYGRAADALDNAADAACES